MMSSANNTPKIETRFVVFECGLEWEFDPRVPGAIGKPLYVLMEHRCKENGD
jgi:hypothetical protein